jgi:hypothetical protein
MQWRLIQVKDEEVINDVKVAEPSKRPGLARKNTILEHAVTEDDTTSVGHEGLTEEDAMETDISDEDEPAMNDATVAEPSQVSKRPGLSQKYLIIKVSGGREKAWVVERKGRGRTWI